MMIGKRLGRLIQLLLLFIYSSFFLEGRAQCLDIDGAAEVLSQAEDNRCAQFAACVWDVDQEESMFQFGAERLFIPASITKIVTTSTALTLLSPSYRFVTNLSISGTIEGRTLKGDLILTGNGDPSLWSRKIPEDSVRLQKLLHDALSERGIDRIEGSLVVDASRWCPEGYNPTWAREDHGDYYAAPVYAFNCFDNHIDLYLKAGRPRKKVEIISTYPKETGVKFVNNLRSRKRGPGLDGDGVPLENRRVLNGTVRPYATTSMAVDMPDPALFAAEYLLRYLREKGIGVDHCSARSMYRFSYQRDSIVPLIDYYSPDLSSICRLTNFFSINPFAEALLRSIASSPSSGQCASLADALKREADFLYNQVGIPVSQMCLFDGSGLSRSNRISPLAMCRLLKYMQRGVDPFVSNSFLSSLPQVGYQGTVKKLLPGNSLKIYFKSGYMRGVQTYAGYVFYGDAVYAVCIMANYVRNRSKMKEAVTDFITILFPEGTKA